MDESIGQLTRDRQSTIGLVLTVIVLSMIGIGASVLISFQLLDSAADNGFRDRVEVALAVERQRLQTILEEYSFWDEAYRRTVLAPDPDWITHNLGA
jgi:sensor domain CHASE-containing protein